MNTNKDTYTSNEILLFCSAVMEEEEKFEELLSIRPELAAVCDYLIYGNSEAVNWLFKNDFKILAAFISVIEGDKEAFDFLLNSKQKQWAAVLSLMHNEPSAEEWLLKFKFSVYINLAHALRHQLRKCPGLGINTLGTGGLGSSGGGFGGFGGGSFGGAGAGGSW